MRKLLAAVVIASALLVVGCGGEPTGSTTAESTATPPPSEAPTTEKPAPDKDQGSGIPEADAAEAAATAASDEASKSGFEVDPSTWEVTCQVENDQLSSCTVSRQGCEGDVMIYRESVDATLEAQDASVACAD